MLKHKSLTPTAISSRFSNWSYHDLGHAFSAFGKEKAAGAQLGNEGDKVALTSDKHDVEITNSRQWTTGRKVLHLMVTYQAVFLCSLAITTVLPETQHNDDQPEPNPILSNIPYAAFLIGMSVGWLFGSPVISLHRRRWPTITMTTLLAGAELAIGLSKGLILVSVFRALAGFFAAIILSLCLANIQDMFANPSSTPYLLLMLIAGVGSAFGPSYQYLLSSKLAHRWVSILIMFALFPFMICTFFMHDTKPRPSTKDVSTMGLWRRTAAYARLAIGRPVYLFFANLSIVVMSLSAGFNIALCYALYSSLPSVLATTFTQSQIDFSLSTFALAVGYVVSFICLLIYCAVRASINPPQDLLALSSPLPTIIELKKDDEEASENDGDEDEDKKSIKSAKSAKSAKSDKTEIEKDKEDPRIKIRHISHSDSDSDCSSSSSQRSSISNDDVEKAVKNSKKSTPLSKYRTRWFWPMVPIVILMPLALAFIAMTSKSWYPVFAPLAFVLIFAACAFVSFACGFLYIHEKFEADEKQSSAVAIYMFVVFGMSAGLCVVITHLLKSLALKALFGIFAGVTALTSFIVLLLWLRLRKAKI